MRSLPVALWDDFVVEPGGEHVGQEQAAESDIEGKRRCEKTMTHDGDGSE
ncbi:MAG TPA: hypothetical protein VF772_09180 [Terriglobales bacterium]